MSNEDKVYPTHRISFSEKQMDEQGKEKLGHPMDVATVWPRKNEKHGGIIQWHIAPEKLRGGVYFMLENERRQTRQTRQSAEAQRDGFDQSDPPSHERDSGLSR